MDTKSPYACLIPKKESSFPRELINSAPWNVVIQYIVLIGNASFFLIYLSVSVKTRQPDM
jgi:hypothetical protein